MSRLTSRSSLRRTLIAAAVLQTLAWPASAQTFTWSTGTFPGDSGTPATLLATQTLNIVPGGTKFLNSAFASQGTINATDDLYFLNNNVLANGGLYDLRANVGLLDGGFNGGFNNTGIFRKSAGAGTSFIGIAGFTSSGVVDAQVGVIQFGAGASFGPGSQFTGGGNTLVTNGAGFSGALTSANLVLAGGTFSGTTAQINGTVNWTAGSLVGTWSVASGQALTLNGGGTKFVNGSLGNAGTITANDDLYFLNNNALTNTGVFDLNGNFAISDGGFGGTFVNSGTLRKSAGTGASTVGIAGFSNSGTIEAQTGSINFASGAVFGNGTAFKGPSAVIVSNGASFNGAFTTEGNLVLAAGVYTGTGTAVNGDTTWTAGRFDGTWELSAGKTLALNTGGTKYINGTFTNKGSFVATDDLYFLNNNTLANTALYDFKGDVGIYDGGFGGTMVNTGTLRKSVGAGTSYVSIQGFSNSGTIEAQTGNIEFNAGPAFGNGTVFKGPGTVVVSGGASFNGSFTTEGNLVLSAGIYTGSGAAVNGDTTWTAGRFDGTWELSPGRTLTLAAGGTKTINGPFTNKGSFAATDDLYFINNNTLANTALYDFKGDVGIYNGGFGGTMLNTGTLRKSVGTGRSYVSIQGFSNSGTIEAQTGIIEFNAGPAFGNGTVFKGPGTVVVSSSGASFNGGFTTEGNLVLAGGVFAGGGGGPLPNATLANGSVGFATGRLDGTWVVGAGTRMDVVPGGSKFVNGTIINQGLMAATDELQMLNNNTLNNEGVYDFKGDVGISNGGFGGNFVNTGLLVKSVGDGVSSLAGIAFTNAAGGVVDVRSGTVQLPANFTNRGTLKGAGAYQTNQLTNAGRVAPGESPGTLTIHGNFAQTARGSFDVELGGLAGADMLSVNGSAFLDGTLDLICFGACTYSVGQQITILSYTGALTGAFAGNPVLTGFASGAFTVSYAIPNSVVLTVTEATVPVVPEPGTWAMLLAGLGVVGLLTSRRRT
jgi:hypothetical protein